MLCYTIGYTLVGCLYMSYWGAHDGRAHKRACYYVMTENIEANSSNT